MILSSPHACKTVLLPQNVLANFFQVYLTTVIFTPETLFFIVFYSINCCIINVHSLDVNTILKKLVHLKSFKQIINIKQKYHTITDKGYT